MAINIHDSETQAISTTAGGLVGGGLLAGALAGAIMALCAMIYFTVIGGEFWMPVKLMAAYFYGPEAVDGGWLVILVGIVSHLALFAILGLIFALVFGKFLTTAAALFVGMIYGIVIWAIRTWLTLPLLNEAMNERLAEGLSGLWFALHLIFGAMLFFMPSFVRGLSRPKRKVEVREEGGAARAV